MNTWFNYLSKGFELLLLESLKFLIVGLILFAWLIHVSMVRLPVHVTEEFLIELPDVGTPTPEPHFPALLESLILIEDESSVELETGYDRNTPLLF